MVYKNQSFTEKSKSKDTSVDSKVLKLLKKQKESIAELRQLYRKSGEYTDNFAHDCDVKEGQLDFLIKEAKHVVKKEVKEQRKQDENKDYSQIEEKVQSKLDELVAKYEKQRKSASSGSQSYDRCISTVNEIKHFKSFAKEFLDIEIDFWRQQKNQYDPGPIVDCRVVSKEDIFIEDHEQ